MKRRKKTMSEEIDLYTLLRVRGALHFKASPPLEDRRPLTHDPANVVGFLSLDDGKWNASCCGAQNFNATELRRIAFELDCLSGLIKSGASKE